jgi:hypothetical protein
VFGGPLEAGPTRSVETGVMSLQIPTVHRTPELRFRALLTEGATWQVEVGKL